MLLNNKTFDREGLPSYLEHYRLNAPSEYKFLLTFPRPSAVVDRTVRVNMVPDVINVEDVISALAELTGAKISSWIEEDV